MPSAEPVAARQTDAALIAAWQRAQGRRPARQASAGRPAGRGCAGDGRRPARAHGGGRDRRATGGGADAAAPNAARRVSAAGAAGARVRGDRGSARDDTRGRPRALPPCRQAIEGVPAVTHESDFEDERLRELAARLGTRAAERLDVEHTAQAGVGRLREPRPAPAGTWAFPRTVWFRAAALLLAVLGAGVLARSLFGPTPRAVGLLTAGAGLGHLPAEPMPRTPHG